MPTNIVWAQGRHIKAIRAPATERLPYEDRGDIERIRPQGHPPPARQLPFAMSGTQWLKQNRPFSPGHRLLDILQGGFFSLLPCHFHFFPFWSGLIYRSLGVASEPSQECLPSFRESRIGESPGCSRESLSFSARVTWWLHCRALTGLVSLLDATVGPPARPFCAVSRTERPLGEKGLLSVSQWLSVRPFYGRWAKSGFSYIPGGSLMLDPWLHSQKLGTVDPPKGLAPIQMGDPQKWPVSGTPGFARGREKTQNFLAFCCLPVSCPLCLSPSIS